MPVALAQDPSEESRAGQIAKAQAEKAAKMQPYKLNRAEEFVDQVEDLLLTGNFKWHPFFQSAYRGGGFTLGAGYRHPVGDYQSLDMRGSWTFLGYKRLEAEYLVPRLFNRRGFLSVIGGWREATQVGFFGFGTGNTSKDDEVNYSFRQPYLTTTLQVRPFQRLLMLGGGFELTRWEQRPGKGDAPSVEEVYTPATLPGLGASPTYLHYSGTVALDSRQSPGYAKSGGYYGVTGHSYTDPDNIHGFQQVDYEAIQHVPILRDTWVLSLRGRVETTFTRGNQIIPFFMLPSLGGGSDLRGFTSWRFRDRNSLVMSAEWRVLANRFLDMAVFYDAGKVTSRRSEINFARLKSDAGLGFRFHGPFSTPLRIDFAKSNEGFQIVFSANAAF
ncbi:MAG TPA: BamA/TamA family outer membrane protein [Bryobacteraceae bacterium]|nr:BamA/TamA family outer membrane protein [Bryobacteraceae bacterium]